MQHLINALQEMGLNQKEAQTYCALLSIGSNAVSTIAKKTGQNRSSCYASLESLMEKGFIEQIIKNKISYFSAVEPKYILDQLKTKHESLENKIGQLVETMTQLRDLENANQSKSKVVFCQGAAGILNIMEDTLTSKEPLRAYASLDELTDLLPNYFPRYYQRRVEKGLHVKAIYTASIKSYLHKKRDRQELRESRLVPNEYNFHLDILIYDNKVAITSLKEKFGIVIESQEIADAQKRIFDLMWNSSEKYDKKVCEEMEKTMRKIEKNPVRK